MSGMPGTPHFGEPTDVQSKEKTKLQTGKSFDKEHYRFDPAQLSRAMGSTLGDAPGCGWDPEKREADYMCNHDGFSGGNAHNLNMDEQKVLHNKIYGTKFEYDYDMQTIHGSDERSA